MSDEYHIQLKLARFKDIPLEYYDKDFTFIINDNEYPTCRLIADILSPKICRLHTIDPTIKEYKITTQTPGNFQQIINLLNFEDQNITRSDMPFINEILAHFDNPQIRIQVTEPTLTIENSVNLLMQYKENPSFFTTQIDKCIDFISANFGQIIEHQRNDIIQNFDVEILTKILSNEQLKLNSEDQLLNLINGLYENERSNSILYKYVDFTNLTNPSISEFLAIFDYSDIDHEIWVKLSKRIQGKTLNLLSLDPNEEIREIFHQLQQRGELKNEVALSYSQLATSNCKSAENIFAFDNDDLYFETENIENSFIRFEFKNKKIIPTSYTIKTTQQNRFTPKSWVIEGSNDKNVWETIDFQSCHNFLRNQNDSFTVSLKDRDMKEFKYIQMRQTGPNSYSKYYLVLNSIEFDGFLQ